MPDKGTKWSKEARERRSEAMKEAVARNSQPPPRFPKAMWDENVMEQNQESPVPVSAEQRYIAKREFDYVDDERFELGQIVYLRGYPNDKKLVGLGYVVPWDAKPEYEHECIQCGKRFGSSATYTRHCALHYDICSICNKRIPPETKQRHLEAHAELAV